MTKTCPQCGLTLQGRDNEADTCSDCLLGLTDESYSTIEGVIRQTINEPIMKPTQPMKVKELIKLLEECDRDLPVYIYRNDGELFDFDVDDSISDRIDINITDEERYINE